MLKSLESLTSDHDLLIILYLYREFLSSPLSAKAQFLFYSSVTQLKRKGGGGGRELFCQK